MAIAAVGLAIACYRRGGACCQALSPTEPLLSHAVAAVALAIACYRRGRPCFRVLARAPLALARARPLVVMLGNKRIRAREAAREGEAEMSEGT